MAFGLGRMRLAPRDFWAMTPRELEAALVGAGLLERGDTPTRGDLANLMASFPDGFGRQRKAEIA